MPRPAKHRTAKVTMATKPALNGASQTVYTSMPSDSDLSKGYLPILIVVTMLGVSIGASFWVGSFLASYNTEKQLVSSRLEGLEKKVDTLIDALRPKISTRR